MGHTAVDYLHACLLVKANFKLVGPLGNFILPTMHQTLELLCKAIAFKIDSAFDPRKFSHHTYELLVAYENQSPVFTSTLANPKLVELLKELEKSYLGVRYGECYHSQDSETWDIFLNLTDILFDDLQTRTSVPFLPRHHKN